METTFPPLHFIGEFCGTAGAETVLLLFAVYLAKRQMFSVQGTNLNVDCVITLYNIHLLLIFSSYGFKSIMK